MMYGYMRISTQDQTDNLQRDALLSAGIAAENIYSDTISGVTHTSGRPEWDRLAACLKAEDRVVVWKIDRLGRSIPDVIATVFDLIGRGIVVCSLTEGADSSTPLGRVLIGILASLADLERENIRERVKSGMAAAKARGTHCGRPRAANAETARVIREWQAAGGSVKEIARKLKLSRSLVYKALKEFPDPAAAQITIPEVAGMVQV